MSRLSTRKLVPIVAALTVLLLPAYQVARAQSEGTPAMPPSSTMPAEQAMNSNPSRGMRMSQVQDFFGVPDAKIPPIGEPAITRWVYRDFTVYFESDYVIHSVTHR